MKDKQAGAFITRLTVARKADESYNGIIFTKKAMEGMVEKMNDSPIPIPVCSKFSPTGEVEKFTDMIGQIVKGTVKLEGNQVIGDVMLTPDGKALLHTFLRQDLVRLYDASLGVVVKNEDGVTTVDEAEAIYFVASPERPFSPDIVMPDVIPQIKPLLEVSNPPKSWMRGSCKECGYNVVVAQPMPDSAFFWYCSNKLCKNHKGENTINKEIPEFVIDGLTGMVKGDDE